MRAVLPLFALLISAFSASAREIPFDFVDGYILVHARVDAQPVTLVLDSGASASVLSLDAARRLHLPLGSRSRWMAWSCRARRSIRRTVTAEARD